MMSSKQEHPEILEGEVFLTNADEGAYAAISWKTKRRGTVAYDDKGMPIDDRTFPVFKKASETHI